MILFVLLTFCFITIIMRVIPVCSSVPQTAEFSWCFNSGDQGGLCTISSFCARLDLQNVLVNDVDHEQRLQTGNNLHEFSWIPLLLQQDVGDDEAIADGSDAIENIVEVEGPPAESMQDEAVPFAPTSEPQLRESDIPTRKFFFIVWSSAFCQCHKQFVRESDKCTPDIGLCSLTSPKCLLQEDANAMQRETCYLLCVNLYLLLWWKCSVEFVFRGWYGRSIRVASVFCWLFGICPFGSSSWEKVTFFVRVHTPYWKSIEIWNRFSRPWRSTEFSQITWSIEKVGKF